MRLKIGGAIRPLQEADATIRYEPVFGGDKRMLAVKEIWQIDGTVVLQSNATQSNMTAALVALEQAFTTPRPDLVFLEAGTGRPSQFELLRSRCLSGPVVTNFSYPKSPDKVYSNGVPYTATIEAMVAIGAGNGILEFKEEVIDAGTGGWERVHVGGVINLPEEQIGRQHGVYTYRQVGTAVGLLGYPAIPPAIWPRYLKRPDPVVRNMSPEELGAVDTRFRRSWEWTFESAYKLTARPHRFTTV